MAAYQEVSPVTGIIQEDHVFIDFGDHEGKSILEIADTLPEYYEYLIAKKNDGECTIKRSRDKIFRLYVSLTLN
jgi:broad specificity phosphatase PhoE